MGKFMARIVKGQVVALFAFDVGYEVSLERLSAMLATTPVQPLSRKKQTPTYMQYSKPPQILSLGLATGHFAVAGSIQSTIFDLDRKSTRLNSSHLGISYAVFCLKQNSLQIELLQH